MAKGKRGREAAGDMVRSLGIVLAIVLFVWFFARPPHSDEKKLRVVDATEDVQAFTSAVPGAVVPRGMPTDWKQTVSSYELEAGELRLGWVTPADHYAEYAATSRPSRSFLADITGGGREAGPVDIDGTSWTQYRREEAISLVHAFGPTTVVLGTLRDTATLDELRVLARRRARSRRIEPGLRAVQPLRAGASQLLAALPERERLLERRAAGLEPSYDVGELVARRLVRGAGRIGHVGTLRRATPADAEALTRLRGLMHLAMGAPSLPDEWRTACEAAFRRRLAESDFVAFVVEDGGRIVSCGAGWLEEHLPSPGQYDGRRGHIASMSTEAEHQRRGHARLVFGALMEWFAGQGILRVDLRATEDGRGLYESFGFRVLGGATMAWVAPGVQPGMPGS